MCTTGNIIFWLHTQHNATVNILLVACLIVSFCYPLKPEQPVHCYFSNATSSSSGDKMMDNVCRSQGTYSAYTVGLNKSATYPGLLLLSNLHQQFPYIRVYREYYSWVGFVLFLQTLSFWFPMVIWKRNIGNLIVFAVNQPVLTASDREEFLQELARLFRKRQRQYYHLFVWPLFFEGWNYINVVMQIVLTEKFINFGFERYGRDFFKFKSSLQFDDPREIVFLLFTNCDYFELNSTGEFYVPISVICQLLNNDLNGNIFLFLWFWYRLLFIASIIGIVYRMVIHCFPGVHARLHTFGNQKFNLTLVHSAYGDWFFLKLLAQNIHDFKNVKRLVHKIEKMNFSTLEELKKD